MKRVLVVIVIVGVMIAAMTSRLIACETAIKPPPSLQRLALYSMGRSRPGAVTVDFASHKMVAIGPDYASKPEKWAKVEAVLSDTEVDKLMQLADWDTFRDLNPQPSWFESFTDWRHLDIVWDDREVVYGVRTRRDLSSSNEEWVGLVYGCVPLAANLLILP